MIRILPAQERVLQRKHDVSGLVSELDASGSEIKQELVRNRRDLASAISKLQALHAYDRSEEWAKGDFRYWNARSIEHGNAYAVTRFAIKACDSFYGLQQIFDEGMMAHAWTRYELIRVRACSFQAICYLQASEAALFTASDDARECISKCEGEAAMLYALLSCSYDTQLEEMRDMARIKEATREDNYCKSGGVAFNAPVNFNLENSSFSINTSANANRIPARKSPFARLMGFISKIKRFTR